MSDLDVGAAFQPRFAHSHQLSRLAFDKLRRGKAAPTGGFFMVTWTFLISAYT